MKALQGGFTFIEVMIVITVSIPVLIAVLGTSNLVTSTIHTNERSADVHDVLRSTAERVGQLLRPGVLSTVRIRAEQSDVDAGRALSVGQWIAPLEPDTRQTLQFQSADGSLTINAASYTSVRELEFLMDPAETADGDDDDGDGLVDEGELQVVYDGVALSLLEGIEQCAFTIDGNVVEFFMQVGRANKRGEIVRGSIRQRFYVRNN